jgi:type VI secretion system protein ImpF
MADLVPEDRLQPCLLDRLTDDDPKSQKESRDQRVISMRKYRAGVLRDLEWLLNSRSPVFHGIFDDFDQMSDSVLGYGIESLCGQVLSSVKSVEIESMIIKAIKAFEPRILPNTLSVKIKFESDAASHNAVTLEIKGDLWAEPMTDTLYVKTEIDLETGQCVVSE